MINTAPYVDRPIAPAAKSGIPSPSTSDPLEIPALWPKYVLAATMAPLIPAVFAVIFEKLLG
jgi:hypothetical protein